MKLPIISLTSHGKRIDNAYKTIESLLKMKDFEKIDDYHDMMIMRTAYIENLTHEKAETLLLIADSMSVGLVPVLAQQFSKILLVDVRNAVNLSLFNFSSFDRCIAIQVNDEEHSKYTQCNIDFINSLMK